MPELPEVETVARQLRQVLRKQRFISGQVYDQKLETFRPEQLIEHIVSDVFRNGKEVVLEFRRKDCVPLYVHFHLRMTGRLLWSTEASVLTTDAQYYHQAPKGSPARLSLLFSDGELQFQDTRRFGTASILERPRVVAGMDPTMPNFTVDALRSLLGNSRQPLKVWLLRQDKLVGIGNIYASEILYRSSLDPERSANGLTSDELLRLHTAIRQILFAAIENCGTTFSDFQDTTGSVGSYQEFLQVYDREGEACSACGNSIVRAVHAGRSTFFCRTCQR